MARRRVTCRCGREFEGEVVRPWLGTDHVVCPECKTETCVGKIEKHEIHAGNASFYGQQQVSLVSGCHPTEVKLLKKIMGSKFESCIKDDGSVRFKNQKQQAAYVKRFEQARQQNAADPGCFARRGFRPDDPT